MWCPDCDEPMGWLATWWDEGWFCDPLQDGCGHFIGETVDTGEVAEAA